jgi:starch phosphorylase
VFLPNYDIAMAQPLYPGCDVWLNNPLRPYEACGTSGMKAALNGGLNLSILDGWWDEWYDGDNGWAIPSADGVDDPEQRDRLEADALYDLIENEVAPRFYDHDHEGLPIRWIEMVRHTLKSLGPKVLSTRMVKEYVERLYAPAADAARAINSTYDGARDLAAFKARVVAGWDQVRIDHLDTAGVSESPEVGGALDLSAYVSLGDLAPDDVCVELVHGRVKGEDAILDPGVLPLELVETYEGGRYKFATRLVLDRPGPFGYTVRILPEHPALASAAELGLVALA